MGPERWQQVERLYHAVLESAPEERASFLEEACAGNDALRREVESLLAFDEPASSFIETPPDDVAAGMWAGEQVRSILGSTLGHYKLQSLLGTGGMGEVYRARDLRLDRDVAVKILPEHLAQDAEALRRFEREAKAVAALSHPNILAIHDFGDEQGVSYAVMELLEGETLRGRLQRGAIGWKETVEIGSAIAEGLAAAHAKGVIHRDLKPENIFLTSGGGVKILDFGIARVKRVVSPDAETMTTGIETTKQGVVMGTIGYMSPEQVRGEQADAPSDIFSLGCVLYEMVSGQRPFAGKTGAEVIAAILKEEPPRLIELARGFPAELERIIRHCLEKSPEGRFQSARDLAVDLRMTLTGSGRLIAPRTRKPRWLRPVVFMGLALAALLFGLAIWPYLPGKRPSVIDSLAVLPLKNVSGDVNIEYLSDGITDHIINSLSQLSNLRVMAHATVFTYKNKDVDPRHVGRELKVRAVFTGKMVLQGETLSIQADLVDSADGTQLWGERYNRKFSEIFLVQEEIARQISEKLRLKLSGVEQQRLAKRQTTSHDALKLYFQGRYLWNQFSRESLWKSIDLYNQAIAIDPSFALAYAGIADSYFFMSNIYLPPKDAMVKSRAAAMKALEVDETLAEAHAALATVKANYGWEWEEGERAFKRAIELNPGYASVHNLYGLFLVYQGRFDEAQVEMNRAYDLDPFSPYIHVGTVWPVLFARRYDEAIEQLRRVVIMNPDFPNAHANLSWAYLWNGMHKEAISSATRAAQLDNNWVFVASLGHAYALAGRRDEALKALARLQERARSEHISDFGFAIIYAGLEDKDRAFAALNKAYEARDEYMPVIKVWPFFDSLRSDSRFTDLLRRMNLTP